MTRRLVLQKNSWLIVLEHYIERFRSLYLTPQANCFCRKGQPPSIIPAVFGQTPVAGILDRENRLKMPRGAGYVKRWDSSQSCASFSISYMRQDWKMVLTKMNTITFW